MLFTFIKYTKQMYQLSIKQKPHVIRKQYSISNALKIITNVQSKQQLESIQKSIIWNAHRDFVMLLFIFAFLLNTQRMTKWNELN